jgi:hypothetical protein
MLRIVYSEHRQAAGSSAQGKRLLSIVPLRSGAGGLRGHSAIAELPHEGATDQYQSSGPLENARALGRRPGLPRQRSGSGETVLAVSAIPIRAPGG